MKTCQLHAGKPETSNSQLSGRHTMVEVSVEVDVCWQTPAQLPRESNPEPRGTRISNVTGLVTLTLL